MISTAELESSAPDPLHVQQSGKLLLTDPEPVMEYTPLLMSKVPCEELLRLLPVSVKFHVPCHCVTLLQHSAQLVDPAATLLIPAVTSKSTANILPHVRDVPILTQPFAWSGACENAPFLNRVIVTVILLARAVSSLKSRASRNRLGINEKLPNPPPGRHLRPFYAF